MGETFFCSKCGAPNAMGATFCQKCGATLAPLSVPAPAAAPAYAPATNAYAAAPAPANRYGGFWIRVLAYLIDGVVLSFIFVPVCLVTVYPMIIAAIRNQGMDEGPPVWIFTMFPLLFLGSTAITWLYEALLTSSAWQATVGKKALGLKVTDDAGQRISFGRATGRYFGKVLVEHDPGYWLHHGGIHRAQARLA